MNTAAIRTMAAIERRFRMPQQRIPVRSPAVDGGTCQGRRRLTAAAAGP